VRTVTIIAVLLVSSCIFSRSYLFVSDQSMAIKIVSDTYKPKLDLRYKPSIVWYDKWELEGRDILGRPCIGFPPEYKRCVGGYARGCYLHIVWRGSYSDSAFAHEIMHCMMSQNGEGPDRFHEKRHYWDMVKEANENLRFAGF
jgi:hypothetical protein